MNWFKDLFKGPGNAYWDLGRIVGALASLSMVGAAGWNIWLGLPLDLGPAGLGGGMAAVLTSAAALIYAKDRSSAPAPAQSLAAQVPPAPKARCRKVVKK